MIPKTVALPLRPRSPPLHQVQRYTSVPTITIHPIFQPSKIPTVYETQDNSQVKSEEPHPQRSPGSSRKREAVNRASHQIQRGRGCPAYGERGAFRLPPCERIYPKRGPQSEDCSTADRGGTCSFTPTFRHEQQLQPICAALPLARNGIDASRSPILSRTIPKIIRQVQHRISP